MTSTRSRSIFASVSKKYDKSDDFRNNEVQTTQNLSEDSIKMSDIVDSETLEDNENEGGEPSLV